MMNCNAAYELDIETLLERVSALLDEWGACQRHEPGIGRIGYASMSPGAELIDVAGRDSKDLRAYSLPRRRVEVNGRKVPVRNMIPAQAEKQTRVRKVVSAPEWPAHVQAVERILARMPRDLLSAVCVYYVHRLTIRECADAERVSKSEMEKRLDRARYLMAGQVVTEPELAA